MNKPLRELADVHYGKSPSEVLSEDGPFPVVGTGGIYGRAKTSLFAGPAVVVARKGSLGNPHYMSDAFWPADTTYAVVPKAGIDAKWLYYNLDHFDLTKLNEATGVPSISRDWLCRISFNDPGSMQQQEISEILSTLDEAIEQTEALIAKMQQVKAGLMHDLFTRGVTPDGRLRPTREQAPELYKESPLGWIPREWEVVTTEECAARAPGSTTIGPFGSNLVSSDYRTEGVPVIFVRDVKEDSFEWNSDVFVSQTKAQQLGPHTVKPGDLLSTKMGLPPCVTCAYPDWMEDGIITADIIRLRPDNSKVNTRWLSAALNSDAFKRQVQAITAGVTRPKVTLSDFRKLRIVRPNIGEQTRIASRLEGLADLLTVEDEKLAKIRQQKHGLMHDLLSGKKRVSTN
jgi:type I restriction enzyme S subunit